MDRRTSLKWFFAAAAASAGVTASAQSAVLAEAGPHSPQRAPSSDGGYGHDPDLLKAYQPGDLWPLTFTPRERALATALCDLIIPADEHSPSASSVGVVDFLDEWVSAPYPQQQTDRALLLEGLAWLDEESQHRFGLAFGAATDSQRQQLCNDICYAPTAAAPFAWAARFFARYRDLTAGGFYTSPAGVKDLGYVGNTPLARFDGPPGEVLKRVGLG